MSQEQMRRLETTNPLLLTTSQQCAYALKCLEAGVQPEQIFEKFNQDSFTFDLVMDLILKKKWAWTDKAGQWHVKK